MIIPNSRWVSSNANNFSMKGKCIASKQVHAFNDVFRNEKSSMLQEHQPCDCLVNLQPRKDSPWGPIYNLVSSKHGSWRIYRIANELIQHSKSLDGTSIFIVKKKDELLHLVIDYRGLNKVTIRNQYALPLISTLLKHLSGAKHFIMLDLRGGYYMVWIPLVDEWKIRFCTQYGHFKYIVVPNWEWQLISKFWQHLLGLLQIYCKLS